MSELSATINGAGQSTGLKGTVERHDRWINAMVKVGFAVVTAAVIAGGSMIWSAVAFQHSAQELRDNLNSQTGSSK